MPAVHSLGKALCTDVDKPLATTNPPSRPQPVTFHCHMFPFGFTYPKIQHRISRCAFPAKVNEKLIGTRTMWTSCAELRRSPIRRTCARNPQRNSNKPHSHEFEGVAVASIVSKPLLATLEGHIQARPPIWMMRQAGRHLKEYLELREQARDFLDFCYSPSLAAEATLQPIRRYGMDGAILFADILLILDAMGLGVRFEKGVGPLVDQITSSADLERTNPATIHQKLSPVFETVARVKDKLPAETTLIGFAGAPWTVALYAIEGRGKTDQSTARGWAHQRPDDLKQVLDSLVIATADYLKAQVDAGADVLMLFDSWADGLAEDVFQEIVISPTRTLVERLRSMGVTVPIIGFPRGAGAMLPIYADATGVTAVGLDTAAVPGFVNSTLPASMPVQGHLDPLLLVAGGERLDQRVHDIIDAYRARPHIFNLGHGVVPQTPVAHVERVVSLVKGTA